MSELRQLPEILALDSGRSLVRIPQELDIPLTPRVRQIIDTAEFHRLRGISQLGLVSLVYPAAHHTRFEHSLGVYRMALLYLKQLSFDERFAETVTPHEAEVFIVAALLHDLGHWPFCHPIEDIDLPGVPEHEMFANSFLLEGEIADTLRETWGISPREVTTLLSEQREQPAGKILRSMLSGPIDIDKMDYLSRDSLHAGVPYGRHFDQQRLIRSLCLNAAGDGLAISDKGRTAAEMMVFARYVMFSEVYWHHAVRSATAMLQRAFFLLHHQLDLDTLFRQSELELIQTLREAAGSGPAGELLDGLFGPVRKLYKRLADFSFFQQNELYTRLAGKPYAYLARCADALAVSLSRSLGRRVAPHEILFDAPPVRREVEFRVDVFFPKENCYRPLGEVSPVVKTLAQQQFDDYVKHVRLYVQPQLMQEIPASLDLPALLHSTLDKVGPR
jgi:HD superfamily phosphohydrolase